MRAGITQMDAKYVLAGGTIDTKRNVATPLMMLQNLAADEEAEVIPFEKGGKCFNMGKFLDWAEAGEVHSNLTSKLERALKAMSEVKVPRIKRVRTSSGVAEVQFTPQHKKQCRALSEGDVIALLAKERKKWESDAAASTQAQTQDLVRLAEEKAVRAFKASREYRALEKDVKAFREAQETGALGCSLAFSHAALT